IACAVALATRGVPAVLGTGPTAAEVGDAITELDVEQARALLAMVDCDTAAATLSALSGVKEAVPLLELAKACSRATAGSVVVEDKARGLLVRVQDDGDRVLVPLLSD